MCGTGSAQCIFPAEGHLVCRVTVGAKRLELGPAGVSGAACMAHWVAGVAVPLGVVFSVKAKNRVW